MSTSDRPRRICSPVEASLYLMIAPCPNCSLGPMSASGRATETVEPPIDAAPRVSVEACCSSCGAVSEHVFEAAPGLVLTPIPRDLPEVCRLIQCGDALFAGVGRSAAIDVAGWLTLHSMAAEAGRTAAENATRPQERADARQLQALAGRCLDQALLFYDEGEVLPGDAAFFSEPALRQYRARPEIFSRERLAQARSACPPAAAPQMRSVGERDRSPRS